MGLGRSESSGVLLAIATPKRCPKATLAAPVRQDPIPRFPGWTMAHMTSVPANKFGDPLPPRVFVEADDLALHESADCPAEQLVGAQALCVVMDCGRENDLVYAGISNERLEPSPHGFG